MKYIEIIEKAGEIDKVTGIGKIEEVTIRVDVEWKNRTGEEIRAIAKELGIDFDKEFTVRTVITDRNDREKWLERYEQKL